MTTAVHTPQEGHATGHGEDLMRVVGQLRRSVRRRVRQDWPHAPLPETHLELLRLVSERPGLRVQEAAAALRLAPNTVSTLVNKLVSAGLLERRRDRSDGRAARLHLTRAAVQRIAAWRDRRQALVAQAMGSLAAPDR
jgi:DNA-binding MarR family transcriptional regulator